MTQRILTLASWAYLGALLLLPVVWACKGERQWLLAFLRYSPAIVYVIPPAMIGLAALLTRSPGPKLPLLASLVIIYFLYANPVLNLGRHATGQIKVLTYNILGGRLAEDNRLAEFLKSQDCDLILLQEAYSAPFHPDPVVAIHEQLKDYHLVRAGALNELAILSKAPILRSQEFDMAYRRPGLWADIQLEGRTVRVFNVHYDHFDNPKKRQIRSTLRSTAVARAKQTDRLEAELQRWDGPSILAGDFNSPPGSDTPSRIRAGLQDAYAAVGCGLGQTFPSWFPLWRIDYVYASEHFKVKSCLPLPVYLSDHRPLKAELDLTE